MIRERLVTILAHGRALPSGFQRQREDTTVVIASEAKVADDGLVLDGPWDLARYQSNPVILWMHNRYSPERAPIGRSIQTVEMEPGLIISEILWDVEDPLGAECKRKYDNGFLSAVSIRWECKTCIHCSKLPEEDPRRADDYFVCQGNKLIEISGVTIGCLDTALTARAADDLFVRLKALLRGSPEFYGRVEALFLAQPAPTLQPDPEDPWADWYL